MSILFVSAFKDIGRSRWPIYTRSNEEYIRYFMDLAMNIKYKLIVFIEPHIREILVSKQLPSNIILLDCNLVRTFYDKFIESDNFMKFDGLNMGRWCLENKLRLIDMPNCPIPDLHLLVKNCLASQW